MIRLWEWVWKRRRPDPPGPSCLVCDDVPMTLCPSCKGIWRATGGGVWLLGGLCPSHENHWLP